MKTVKLTKVEIKETKKAEDYMTTEHAVEALETMRVRYRVPVTECIRLLHSSKIRYISIGKDKPYFNLFIHKSRDGVKAGFIVKDADRSMDFDVSFSDLLPRVGLKKRNIDKGKKR